MNSPLSLAPEDLAYYSQNGFVKVNHPVFSETDFASYSKKITEIKNAELPQNNSSAISSAHWKYPELLYWMLSDNVLDIAEDILGPNIGLWTSSIFFKRAHSTDKAYWHQDIANVYRYKLFENRNLINFTISLTKTDRESGCLQFLPGTQKFQIEHNFKAPKSDLISNNNAIDPTSLNTNSAVLIELDTNEASVHNINVVHGSEANTSDRDRLTTSFRFFSASEGCNLNSFKVLGPHSAPFLVRGMDLTASGLKRLAFS